MKKTYLESLIKEFTEANYICKEYELPPAKKLKKKAFYKKHKDNLEVECDYDQKLIEFFKTIGKYDNLTNRWTFPLKSFIQVTTKMIELDFATTMIDWSELFPSQKKSAKFIKLK